MAELSGIFKMLMFAKRVAGIAVEADVVEEIIALKNRMVLQHEIILLADERLENRRRQLGMVKAAQEVANIVQECAHNIFVIAAIFMGARGGLQRMLIAVDSETAKIALQHFQMIHDPIGQGFRELPKSL